MIIDFHVHVLPPQIKTDRSRYVEKDKAFAQIYSGEKVKIATAEDLIESMDKDGVDVSVIVNYSWTTPALCWRPTIISWNTSPVTPNAWWVSAP
jgi:hypothetical protein